MHGIKAFIQGFLPGIVLKIFLILLPMILMIMSKIEGFISTSLLERRSATRYYIFKFVNVFLGSIVAGAAFEQLNTFINQPANKLKEPLHPCNLSVHRALRYAQHILRHYAYVVFRHQIINVYNQEYESAAAFWPDVHARVIAALIISQLLLLGLLSTKEAAQSTPFLIVLVVLTIWFHTVCKSRFEPAFKKYPLQEAKMKDTIDQVREPNIDMKGYLKNAYVHPALNDEEDEMSGNGDEWGDDDNESVVATKRKIRKGTLSKSSSARPLLKEDACQMA
ncbi:hypothetical protein ACHQM5_000061 [Ranunculus cassubicifolius]